MVEALDLDTLKNSTTLNSNEVPDAIKSNQQAVEDIEDSTPLEASES